MEMFVIPCEAQVVFHFGDLSINLFVLLHSVSRGWMQSSHIGPLDGRYSLNSKNSENSETSEKNISKHLCFKIFCWGGGGGEHACRPH